MKAFELRIGNFVLDYEGYVIETITAQDLIEADEDGEILRQPIPLTEAWLLRIGLKHYEEISTEKFFGGMLYVYEDEWVIIYDNEFHFIRNRSSSDYDGSTEYRTTKIESVHQLQNLYFALTGKELIFRAISEQHTSTKHVSN